MTEIWKNIEGYEGKYQVSNLGRVKSMIGQEKVLHPKKHRNGHLQIGLHKDKKRKTMYIHRLVAQAFIPNPDNLPQVNHIDENKENNHVDNLEWCTNQYNTEYSQAKAVIAVDKISGLKVEFSSIMKAERMTGIDHSHIIRCCQGKRRSTGGFYWHYVNEDKEDK